MTEDENKELYAALKSWGLLACCAHPDARSGRLKEAYGSCFARLLFTNSLQVRTAVGENLALLYESSSQEIEIDGKEDPDRARIVKLLEEVFRDSDKHSSKKDKATKRTAFREIIASVQRGDHPEDIIRIKTEKLEFNSWDKLIPLAYFRDILGSGLVAHLQDNDFIRRTLNIGFIDLRSAPTKLSKNEKKAFMEESNERGKQRAMNKSAIRKNFSRDLLSMDEGDESGVSGGWND